MRETLIYGVASAAICPASTHVRSATRAANKPRPISAKEAEHFRLISRGALGTAGSLLIGKGSFR